jgi:hypothetical protein
VGGGLELELAPRPTRRRSSDPPPAHSTRVSRRPERARSRGRLGVGGGRRAALATVLPVSASCIRGCG